MLRKEVWYKFKETLVIYKNVFTIWDSFTSQFDSSTEYSQNEILGSDVTRGNNRIVDLIGLASGGPDLTASQQKEL